MVVSKRTHFIALLVFAPLDSGGLCGRPGQARHLLLESATYVKLNLGIRKVIKNVFKVWSSASYLVNSLFNHVKGYQLISFNDTLGYLSPVLSGAITITRSPAS